MSLFPAIEPYATGLLAVGEDHVLFWERSGNPKGLSVLFLHGGPGSGSSPRHRRYYDPAHWDIVQFDQRGCGRSTPLFSLEANTTSHLIEDIEALRHHLGIEQWVVIGPSWGSTLALAYATSHPDRVRHLIVEGVFLGTPEEIRWWHRFDGAGAFFPEALSALMKGAPDSAVGSPNDFIQWALETMLRELDAGVPQLDELTKDTPSLEQLNKSLIFRWSFYEETLSWLRIADHEIVQSFRDKGRDWVISHSLIEAHYFAHNCFLEKPLLDKAPDLTMPVQILQSRYDLVCPYRAAHKLHKTIPGSRLQTLPMSGHAMTDSVFEALTQHFKTLSEETR